MSKKCGKCNKSVYHNDPQLPLGGKLYHKSCARCATCNGYLSIKNFTTSGERLLCKVHFKEEFSMGGGKYAGDEKFKHSLSGSLHASRSTSPTRGQSQDNDDNNDDDEKAPSGTARDAKEVEAATETAPAPAADEETKEKATEEDAPAEEEEETPKPGSGEAGDA